MIRERGPAAIRLLAFLAAGLTLSVLTRPSLLYGIAGLLGVVALVRGLPRSLTKVLAWSILAPLPTLVVLFVCAGREATGAWGTGCVWGLQHLLPYTTRLAALMLLNLLYVHATSLPELMGALRAFPIPQRAVLLLATLIRFLPTALEEVRRVLEVQRCRGLARRRLLTPTGLLSLAVPLFLAQIQRSHDLALSLEIRDCADPRTLEETP